MSVHITYFAHGTTTDNEQGVATGWNPGELSELGKKQSLELGKQIGGKFDIVFCSDLKRAVDSANLAFGKSVLIKKDKRLRECNYGDKNGSSSRVVDAMTVSCIDKPFPNGESYSDVEKRVRDFCRDLNELYDGKRVAIVSHRGPQLALEVIVKGKSWTDAIREDWRHSKKWQPGWDYVIE